MKDIAVVFLVALIIAGGLLMIGVIVRFSVVSPRRRRRARTKIRQPDLAGAEQVCGFQLPSELAPFYREAAIGEQSDIELIDDGASTSGRWEIAEFYPLTEDGAREGRAISGVAGLPIAKDHEKGTYYIDASGAVLFQSALTPGQPQLVAQNIEALLRLLKA